MGVLEVRPLGGSRFEVIRMVTYDRFSFEGLRVQEVWVGKGSLQNGELTVVYSLKQGDLISQSEHLKRTPEQFRSRVDVTANYAMDRAEFQNGGVSFTETVGMKKALSGPLPLWRDERRVVQVQEREPSFVFQQAWKLLAERVIDWYRSQPEVQAYADRPEFQSQSHFVVWDPTDFDFYQRNPDLLRVVNKPLDEISMLESLLRRNAYAPMLIEKANHFESELHRYGLNDLGLYIRTEVDANGNPVNQEPDGDCALWTGMYAGAQAMRFLTTKEPEALDNFKKSLRGLFLLMDVTGDPRQFARNVQRYVPGQNYGQNWQRGAAPFDQYMFLRIGNNDMFKGLIHSFAWAFKILPAGDELWPELKAHASRLTQLEIADKVQNQSPAAGLVALATHEASWRDRFVKAYKRLDAVEGLVGSSDGFYYHGVADWSGINLSMVSTITDILIAEQMNK
jgi:hypothetical protein